MVGKSHTFNGMGGCGDGEFLVRNDWLRHINVHSRTTQTVTVGAGVTVDELDVELSKHGFCVRTNVLLKCVTYAGILQTGSHGCGYVPITEEVVALTLVDGRGQVHYLTRDNDIGHRDVWKAVIQAMRHVVSYYTKSHFVYMLSQTWRWSRRCCRDGPTPNNSWKFVRKPINSSCFTFMTTMASC